MAINPNSDFSQQIPNNPFYSPLSTYVVGPYHPWVSVTGNPGFNFATGTITAGGGGGGSGTVTSVTAGAGLSGGTINVSGTIAIANTGVTPGTYNNSIITVNTRGQLTSVTAQPSALTIALLTAKGDIITATSPNSPTILPVGVDTYILSSDSTTASGLRWIVPPLPLVQALPELEGIVYGYTQDLTTCNVGLGYQSLAGTIGTPSQHNTAVGHQSQVSTSGVQGSGNTSTGFRSLYSNTSGKQNTSFGEFSLQLNSTGRYNTAVGSGSLFTTTASNSNTALGYNSLYSSTGSCNTSVGFCNSSGSTGQQNTSVGASALSIVTGNGNTSVGLGSLCRAVNSAYNVAIGHCAASFQTSGNCNVIIGSSVQAPVLTGSGQLAIGSGVGSCWLTGCADLAVKPGAGVIDCAGSCGAAGQLLSSTGGNAIQWTDIPAPDWATPVLYGIVQGCTIVDAGPVFGRVSLGCNALLAPAAAFNTAIGNFSQCSTTSGECNTSVGFGSMRNLGSGSLNTALGTLSMVDVSTGCCNVAVGADALRAVGAGEQNTAVGTKALAASSGLFNTAVGSAALYRSTDNFNTSVGAKSSYNTLAGADNTVVGAVAFFCNTAGSQNVALGRFASYENTCGNGNVSVGYEALRCGTTGCYNTGLGSSSLLNATIASCNTAVGNRAQLGVTEGLNNSSLGALSLCCLTSGGANTAVGFGAGCSILSGSFNLTLGHNTQVALPDGSCQMALGWCNTCNWLTGDDTKAIKPGAGIIDCANSCGFGGQYLMSDGANAVCWGYIPLANSNSPGLISGNDGTGTVYNTGCNVSLGVAAINLVGTGASMYNTGIGFQAGLGLTTNGVGDNTAVGYRALLGGPISGGYNTALGSRALFNAATGSNNTAVGYRAMVGGAGLLEVDGSNNTALGSGALACVTTGTNNAGLGYQSGADALCTLTFQDNRVILGNNNTSVIYGKSTYTNASDIRWKKVDGAVPLALPFVQALNPIKYQFCDPATGEVTDDRYRYGFSAQEIIANEVNPEHPIIASTDNPEMFALSETMLLPVLVNAVKELSAELTALKAEVATLKQQA